MASGASPSNSARFLPTRRITSRRYRGRPWRGRTSYDVVVIGGGHNGLVAAGLLAKAGQRVVVLERRGEVGGAADHRAAVGSRLQDDRALLRRQPDAADDPARARARAARLQDPPAGPLLRAPSRRPPRSQLSDDPAARRASIAQFSATRRRRVRAVGGVAGRPRRRARAAAHRDAAAARLAAARRPRSTRRSSAGSARALGRSARSPTSPACSPSSIADLLEDHFESDAMRGVLVGERRHRHVGRARGRRAPPTSWPTTRSATSATASSARGASPRAAWARSPARSRDAAESFGADGAHRTDVARILVAGRSGRRRRHRDGRGDPADVVIAATHPQITFLRQLDAADLPADFVARPRRWKTRSGTVKVNLALDRLPDVHRQPGLRSRRPRRHDRARAEPRPRRAGVPGRGGGRPAARPFADICIPSRVRPDARARGQARDVDVHAVGAERVVDRAAPRRARRLRRPGRSTRSRRSRPASPTRSCTGR